MMLDNIRKIGLFMIAAQAVIHFAPGKQYEKYIKLVSSVIILTLFIKPFVSGQTDLEREWRTGMEQVVDRFEKEDSWEAEGQNANDRALVQLEEEIKSRLNDNILSERYRVDSVSLIFDRAGSVGVGEEYNLQFQRIEIVMTKKEEGSRPVLVEEIVIPKEPEMADKDTETALRYQDIFAGILGIERDRVEVTCVGGW